MDLNSYHGALNIRELEFVNTDVDIENVKIGDRLYARYQNSYMQVITTTTPVLDEDTGLYKWMASYGGETGVYCKMHPTAFAYGIVLMTEMRYEGYRFTQEELDETILTESDELVQKREEHVRSKIKQKRLEQKSALYRKGGSIRNFFRSAREWFSRNEQRFIDRIWKHLTRDAPESRPELEPDYIDDDELDELREENQERLDRARARRTAKQRRHGFSFWGRS